MLPWCQQVRWFVYDVTRRSGKEVATGELCLHCGLALETWPLQKQEDKVARLKAGDFEFRKDRLHVAGKQGGC